jgi:hypothetical protein
MVGWEIGAGKDLNLLDIYFGRTFPPLFVRKAFNKVLVDRSQI